MAGESQQEAADHVVDKLLGSLPDWSLIPLALVAVVIVAWPKVQGIWADLAPGLRAYRRERSRLELLKLWYEAEALRRAGGIPENPDNLPAFLRWAAQPGADQGATPKHPPDSTEVAPESRVSVAPVRQITWKRRFSFGCLGGIVMALIPLWLFPFPMLFGIPGATAPDLSNAGWPVVVGFSIRIAMLAVFGGGTALLLKAESSRAALMQGMVPALLMQVLMSASNESPKIEHAASTTTAPHTSTAFAPGPFRIVASSEDLYSAWIE